ncbi:MAG: tryptophan--tRNA ligase [Candidatus Bathyarchaeota archaeon]|nr:MAG: tryptophan--tRNA ligase [Candidatus Bathyarchaeota archaeon]
MVVTPWEFSGDIDYDKLIQRFGTQPLTEEILDRIGDHSGGLHLQLRRGVVFSHRDMDRILDWHDAGLPFVLYTGRGPSGPTHLGHMVSWVFTKHLQDVFGSKLFFQITEDERFLMRSEFDEGIVRHWAFENALDLMALGLDPENTELIANIRHVPKLYETALKVAKRVTGSTVRAIFGHGDDANIGTMFFPAMQAAPCFLASARSGERVPCLIPAGIDQDPFWRLTRDVAGKLRYPKPAQLHCRMLSGLGGGAKMSSSRPETAIYTTDPPEEAEKKIMDAYTGEAGGVRSGKGRKPAACSVYNYFFFLFEESDDRLRELAESCGSGARRCHECKAVLSERVEGFLLEHQAQREMMRGTVADMLG